MEPDPPAFLSTFAGRWLKYASDRVDGGILNSAVVLSFVR